TRNEWLQRPLCSETPLKDALTVFTDAGKKSRRAAITWMADGKWHHHLLDAVFGDSLQTLELAAVTWAVKQWISTPLNIVTDSLYVAGVLQRIEDARIKEVANPRLNELFR
ncbi:PO113 protein, partial [Turnix velox]|nr:PO113 protein [Turnix velox]